MTDVQITIRLGRKTRDDLLVFPRAQILGDDVADEIWMVFPYRSSLVTAKAIGERRRSTTFVAPWGGHVLDRHPERRDSVEDPATS